MKYFIVLVHRYPQANIFPLEGSKLFSEDENKEFSVFTEAQKEYAVAAAKDVGGMLLSFESGISFEDKNGNIRPLRKDLGDKIKFYFEQNYSSDEIAQQKYEESSFFVAEKSGSTVELLDALAGRSPQETPPATPPPGTPRRENLPLANLNHKHVAFKLIPSVEDYVNKYKPINNYYDDYENYIDNVPREQDQDQGRRRADAIDAIITITKNLNMSSEAIDLAENFLTFVVLTHKYSKVGRTGNLRQTVFEHYKGFYSSRGEIQLANVEGSFFDNELSPILTVFKSKGVATADAKERIKALRNIIGQELEKITIESKIISIVDNVKALVNGEYDPAKPTHLLDLVENVVKNIYDPSAATKKYLQEDKKLSEADIDAYCNGTKDLDEVSDKGIIRAVNILRWGAKENISVLEKALINFVVLTHEYSFWSYFITGTLRKRVWDDYKLQNPGMKHIELKNLSDHLLENTLGEITRAFGGNDIKKADAKMRIEACRTWFGAMLEKNTFDPTSDTVQNRIKALFEGMPIYDFSSNESHGLRFSLAKN